MKRITISLSDWVHETYIEGLHNNTSKFVEEMIVKGAEVESGDFEATKQKLFRLQKELRKKDTEIHKLKAQVSRYKADEQTPNELMAEAIKTKGLYYD